MTHYFDADIATEYGLNCAILFQNIAFWVEKSRANEKHFYDGKYWTYNSAKAYNELFPYLSEKQIAYALKRLEDEGLIVTGNYNTNKYDHTKWYAITNFGNSILQKGVIEYDKRDESKDTKGTDQYTDNKPDSKPDNNPDTSGANSFDTFWKVYPKKISRGQAIKAWNKIKPSTDLADRIVKAVETMKTKERWTKDDGKFIPYPATWLNAMGWEDEDAQPEKRYKVEILDDDDYDPIAMLTKSTVKVRVTER